MMMMNMTMYSMFGCLVDGSSHQATALHLPTLNIPPTLIQQCDAFLMIMMMILDDEDTKTEKLNEDDNLIRQGWVLS